MIKNQENSQIFSHPGGRDQLKGYKTPRQITFSKTYSKSGSPSLDFIISKTTNYFLVFPGLHFQTHSKCISSKSLQSLPSPSQIENHPKHFFATEHQQPPRRQWLRLQPARVTHIQGSRQSRSSTNLCLISLPGLLSCQKLRKAKILGTRINVLLLKTKENLRVFLRKC